MDRFECTVGFPSDQRGQGRQGGEWRGQGRQGGEVNGGVRGKRSGELSTKALQLSLLIPEIFVCICTFACNFWFTTTDIIKG